MLPNPILVLGPLKVHMYGVMIAIGLLACFICLFYFCKVKKIDEKFVDFVFYNGIASVVLGFGAAMLFQATYNYIDNPAAGFKIGSGMTFIGGLIGGVVCFLLIYFIFRSRLTGRLYSVLSIVPPCILVAHGFGRIGCFFAGCCHGMPTDSVLGVDFPGIGRVLPTQLYEAAFLFIMFGVCTYLLLRHNFRHNMSIYLISYGVFRFLIEFIRGDERGEFVAGISPSQFWALFMIVGGVALIFLMDYLTKRAEEEKTVAVSDAPEVYVAESHEGCDAESCDKETDEVLDCDAECE